MMSRSIYLLFALFLVPGCGLAGAGDQDQGVSPTSFKDLLVESGMEFISPEGFSVVPVRSNPLLPYEHAILSAGGALEIRYALRPLGRIQVDYDDPHSATPDPNHMFPLMFQSLVTSLSNGTHSPMREYTPEQAMAQFNADWAAAAVFDVNPDFNSEHGQALILALHKNQLTDAYAVLLFDGFDQARAAIKENLDALRFLPGTP